MVRALDARCDAWRGGALFAKEYFTGSQLGEFTISKREYEECGHHYLKEHMLSNYAYGAKPAQAVRLPKSAFVCDNAKRVRTR